MSIILLFKKLFSNTINFIFTLIIFSLIWSADLYIENVDLDSGTLDIMMTNEINIGGFQFNLSGLDITGASGGSATENGFMISNSSSTLLGFSLTGSSIPPGSGVLIDVTFENYQGSEICIEDVVLSDTSGGAIDVNIGECFELSSGCTDLSACNYNEDAVADDGSCAYDFDCTGECGGTAELDCNDECDGGAVVDCNSECGGGAVVDCNDECDGGAVVDCNGECGGGAEVDACGECGGNITDPNDCGMTGGNVLSISDGNVNAGEQTTIELSLDNPYDIIAGFEFYLTDFPNSYGSFVDVLATDRTSGFQISAQEQADGTYIIVGFDLSLIGISQGEGPILTVDYQSDGIYTAEIDIDIPDNSILSDALGTALEYTSNSGLIYVSGEDPPPIFAPESLQATGGLTMVTLSWEHPEPWSVSSYNIYRDGLLVGNSISTSYADSGLLNTIETYCYTVTAVSTEEVESLASNEACAETTDIYLEEPPNLTAEQDGLEIFLDWDTPPSAIGVGDECETAYGIPGFIDCSGVCFDATLADIWIGDGFCDGTDAAFGVNFSCSEWSCDGCDCFGTGNNSEECVEECGGFMSSGNNNTTVKEMAEGLVFHGSRELLGYEIFRNDAPLDYTTNTEYLDINNLEYLSEYCYNVTAVYDEGSSAFSDEACATPQLNGPSGLSVQATGSFLTLGWTPPLSNDQDGFNIYRDDEFYAYTTEVLYEDHETDIGIEYCYFVKAVYDGIGESPSTNTSCQEWEVYPPSNIVAEDGDGYVDLTWDLPVGGEEVSVQYDDGVLANAFYFWDTYEMGYAHGTRFDLGVDFDVLAASVKILSEGDEFWPWPDSNHGPVRILLFNEVGGIPGDILHEEEAVAADGWATIYPNLTGLSGVFYIIVTHEESWTDPEGFGVDGAVDYPESMATYNAGAWTIGGDVLGYGGDYMVATQVFAYGDIQNVSYSNNMPQSYLGDYSEIRSTINLDSSSSSQESHPWYIDSSNRELSSFDIFRDDLFIANIGADVFSYRDEPLENMIEYCYTLRSNYDEGVSEFSDLVCETPNPGAPASNLVASDLQGTIGLDWTAAPSDNVLDYSIYRDGEPIASTTETLYEDISDIVAGVEYCYDVRARYTSGETFPTNTACAIYTLDPPVGMYAEGNDQDQNILVTWNEPGAFVLYDVTCDGGSWQSEVTWELEYFSDIVLTGNAPFSQDNVELFYGDYILYMHDSYGDGWNGNIFNLYDQNGNLGASCTLDTGSEGTCEFTLGGDLASTGGIEPVIAVDNAPENKEELVALDEENSSTTDETEVIIEEFIQTTVVHSRDLLGYNLYRDGELIAEFDNSVFSYVDEDTEHDTVYCYTIKSVYDDGLSIPSNESCDEWILAPATEFNATGTNGQVELVWNAAQSPEVLSYNIYRGGNFLMNTIDAFYNDTTAEHDTEYCYQITAVYDLGESAPSDEECAMWEILAPSDLTAEGLDGYVHLEWTDPPDGGTPGVGDECIAYDYYYNETLGFVDCIGQCIPEATVNSWLGDGLCDDGSWGVYFNCDEWDWDNGDCPEYSNGNNEDYSYRTEDQLGEIGAFVNHSQNQNRDLIAFNIYRAGEFLTQVDAGIYEYDDYDVINLDTYCYTVTSVYDEGESANATNEACATPEPGIAPSDLFAFVETDVIVLEWQAGSAGVIDYNIYRDGSLFATAIETNFSDDTAEHDIEYCYIVTANYPSGESLSTNESCAMWVLAAPMSISATGGNGFIQVEWTEPGVNTCANEVIPSLPFNTYGTNLGETDDWLVQGGQGADYSYLLVVTNPITIDVTLCSMDTDYDTKLEIFTADQDCIETTTGNYIDDDHTNCPEYVAPYPPSGLWGVFLNPGEYYIVVDGYSGAEGNYEIFVSESTLAAQGPSDIEYSITYESEKSGEDINHANWIVADGSNSGLSRDLLGFDLYRDGSYLDSVGPDVFSYLDLDLENGTQYCYHIIASYDEGDSQPTPQVCASPDAGPMCPPENLVTSVEDGDTFVHLDWDAPSAGCEEDDGDDGGEEGCVYDWTNYGAADCDAAWDEFGIDCATLEAVYGWDCLGCECPGDGFMSEHDDFSDYLDVFDSNTSDPQLRLNGYSIYRNLELIDQVGVDATTFNDNTIEFGVEYCYKVKAIYDDGESNPTNESCEIVIDPGTFSTLEIPSITVEGGENFILPISLSNQLDVAGFQFTLSDNPNLLTGINAETTDRTEGFQILINELDGELIVAAFSLTGGLVEAGDGPIVTIEYSSMTVDSDQDISVSSYDVILGDPSGEELPSFGIDGTITLTAEPPMYGCTDPEAENYNSDANVDDGSCLYTQTLSLDMEPFMMNLSSINISDVNGDMSIENLFPELDILLMSDDNSDFYVPNFGINQIEEIDIRDGYRCFLDGSNTQSLILEGFPNSMQDIQLDPYMLNLISYLPGDCMSTDYALGSIEDNILLVSDDQGGYYIPSYGIMTMEEMCPGEGYALFTSVGEIINFTYPSMGAQARSSMHTYWEEYNQNTVTESYSDLVVPTGISYPIIITQIDGNVSVGDELVAYANGQVVGATRIADLGAPVVISAWGGFNEYGIYLEGYSVGDKIDLRLYSNDKGEELMVNIDLDNDEYGVGVFASGTVTASDMLAVPEEYILSQNYPNPFNPSTTISFSVPVEGNVVLNIYDITGRLVTTLVDANMNSGYHSVNWDGIDLNGSFVSAGLYIYSLQAEGVALTRKMVLMK